MSPMENLLRTLALIAVLAFGSIGLTGCEEQGPMEEAGEEIDDAGDEMGDELDDAEDERN